MKSKLTFVAAFVLVLVAILAIGFWTSEVQAQEVAPMEWGTIEGAKGTANLAELQKEIKRLSTELEAVRREVAKLPQLQRELNELKARGQAPPSATAIDASPRMSAAAETVPKDEARPQVLGLTWGQAALVALFLGSAWAYYWWRQHKPEEVTPARPSGMPGLASIFPPDHTEDPSETVAYNHEKRRPQFPPEKKGWREKMPEVVQNWLRANFPGAGWVILLALMGSAQAQEAGIPPCKIGPILAGGLVTAGQEKQIQISVRGCGEVKGIKTTGSAVRFGTVSRDGSIITTSAVVEEDASASTRPIRLVLENGSEVEAPRGVFIIVRSKSEEDIRREAAAATAKVNTRVSSLREEMIAGFAELRKESGQPRTVVPLEASPSPNHKLVEAALPSLLERIDRLEKAPVTTSTPVSSAELEELRKDIRKLFHLVDELAENDRRIARIQVVDKKYFGLKRTQRMFSQPTFDSATAIQLSVRKETKK